MVQAEIIGERFKAKVYDDVWIKDQIQYVNEMDRTVMLQNKPKKKLQQETPCLILDYNVQYKDIAKLIQRHILKKIRILKIFYRIALILSTKEHQRLKT